MKILTLLSFALATQLGFANGHDGKDIVINDLTQPAFHNLSGKDGSDGSNGSEGSSGRCYTNDDSARGEDGGDGKDGEDGGNGGNAIVHFNELSELKNLKMISLGGRGGSGGKGGTSGFGCGGAHSGSDGKPGRYGDDGKKGSLYLVKNPQVYSKNQTFKRLTLSELMKNETVLSENVWDKFLDAEKLLASGSHVSNEYFVLNRVFKKKIIVKWLTDLEASKFSSVETSLSVVSEKLKINYAGYIADQTVEVFDDHIEISILNLIKESGLIKLSSPKFSGIGDDIKLEFLDSSLQIEGISYRYEVSVLKMGVFNATYIFSTPNAKDIISVNGKKVEMALGRLAFDSKHKDKGSRLLINFTIHAEVNGQQKSRSFVTAYKVGKSGSSFERSRTDF